MGQVGFTTVLIACIKPLFEPKSASLPNIASVVVKMVKFLKNPLPLCQLVIYLAKEGGGLKARGRFQRLLRTVARMRAPIPFCKISRFGGILRLL